MRPIVHHIPICPFCQRLEILLELEGRRDAVEFRVVDITQPRDPALLALTGGSTALPVMELEGGRALKESLVLMEYLDDIAPDAQVRRTDPWERAVENLLVTLCSPLVNAGYGLVMNQDRAQREGRIERWYAALRDIDAFLRRHATPDSPWLFDTFGWAEAVFTPMFQRFWFVPYYEGIDMEGDELARVRAWRDACVAHPAAQQTSEEEIVKLYYDYAAGFGNGQLPEGRTRSTFAFEPHWQTRPWPPRDKYGPPATDEALGLLGPVR